MKMEHLKKAGFLICFMLITLCKSYSQDSTRTDKKIYKITYAEAIALNKEPEIKLAKANNRPVYSCEIDSTNKKVIVSFLEQDGSISKETYELIEDKK
jgi:hypothetical protein